MKTKYKSLILIISLINSQIFPPGYPNYMYRQQYNQQQMPNYQYQQSSQQMKINQINQLPRRIPIRGPNAKNLTDLEKIVYLRYLLVHPEQDPRYAKQQKILKDYYITGSLRRTLTNPIKLLKITQKPRQLKKLLIKTRKLGMMDTAIKAAFLPLIALAAAGAIAVGKQLWDLRKSPYMLIPAGLTIASLLGYFLDRTTWGQKVGNFVYPFPRSNPADKWDTDAVNRIHKDLGDLEKMKDNIIFNKSKLGGLKQELNIKVARIMDIVDKCEESVSAAEEDSLKNTGDIFLKVKTIGNIIQSRMDE